MTPADRAKAAAEIARLDDSDVLSHGILAVSYIDANGDERYAVASIGEGPMTSFLGLTAIAQTRVLAWGHEPS